MLIISTNKTIKISTNSKMILGDCATILYKKCESKDAYALSFAKLEKNFSLLFILIIKGSKYFN